MSVIEATIYKEKKNLNIHEYAFIKSKQVFFSDEVRSLCEDNACGMYGKSWACPPAVGSVEDCKNKCSEFENAFVFTSLAELKDVYDADEWLRVRIIHEKITDKVARAFRAEFEKILILSAEGCTVCQNMLLSREALQVSCPYVSCDRRLRHSGYTVGQNRKCEI